jgi:hypothetical protein
LLILTRRRHDLGKPRLLLRHRPFGLATLCALGATTFAGHLDTVGENAFDAAATTTHTLRYQDSMLLSAGDIVTINAVNYKVLGVPRQLNTAERLAHLVRQP